MFKKLNVNKKYLSKIPIKEIRQWAKYEYSKIPIRNTGINKP